VNAKIETVAGQSPSEDMVFCLTEKILAVVRESGAKFDQIIAALECARAIVPATDLVQERHYYR
jgi:hypothetical protein